MPGFFREFILKVASRCNLDCDYCYMYRLADQSWRTQPRVMSLDIARRIGFRISEHVRPRGFRSAYVSLHGGEPLLPGVEFLDTFCQAISEAADDVELRFAMQTNGTLFDDAALELCRKWRIRVGLSIDGPRAANDLHRLDFTGATSFPAAERALRLLSSETGRPVWGGILSVIDLKNDPLEVYAYLRSFSPSSIDFVLPLGNYAARPPGKTDLNSTPYADWLLTIFHKWFHERPQTTRIRKFTDIIRLMAGSAQCSEEWGLGPKELIVIETDGTIEGVDTLKSAFPGAARLGMNVFANAFDDALAIPRIRERLGGREQLCEVCRNCDLVAVCGGGYFPHRYAPGAEFQNPSVYCSDLDKLIREIHRTVSAYINAIGTTACEDNPAERGE